MAAVIPPTKEQLLLLALAPEPDDPRHTHERRFVKGEHPPVHHDHKKYVRDHNVQQPRKFNTMNLPAAAPPSHREKTQT